MKRILLLLVSVLSLGIGYGQVTVTYDFSASGAVTGLNEAAPGITLDANIGFGSFKNGGTTNPALSSGQLRLYQDATKGGGIIIYASNGAVITSVVVNASSRTGDAGYDVDGSFVASLSGGSTYTMSGLNASASVEFFQSENGSSNRVYVDDIEVTYTIAAPTPCSGTPAPGNTVSSETSVVSGGTTNLSLQTATSGSGVTYQWQSSTTSAVAGFSNVSGETSSTYTATVNAKTWYQCVVTCSISDGTSTAVFVDVDYCSVTGDTGFGTSITLVDFSNINNSTGAGSGFSDFTSQVANVNQSTSYNLTVNLNTAGNYTVHALAWIDWNQDGVFNTSTEEYDLGDVTDVTDGATSLSPLSIAVPSGASLGNTLMRVVCRYDTDPTDPCNGTDDGEVEDYTINISAITPKTVTFDNNGGLGTISDQTASTSSALTTNTFTRTGFTFTAWNTASDGTGTTYADGANYDFSADITLYAQWLAVGTHTVVFDNNGGSGTMTNQLENATTALTTNTFTRSGYTFNNWNTATDGSGTAYADGVNYNFNADLNLFAQWTANNNTLTFDGNTSTSGSTTGQTIATDASVNLTSNGFVKTGYAFAGWNEAANGSGTSYADAASYTMGTTNTTLYAQWTANDYDVIFDGNGSTAGSMSNQTIAYNTTANLTTNAYTQTGFAFVEWNTAADGSGTSYADGASYTIGLGNETLYAQWVVYVAPQIVITEFAGKGYAGSFNDEYIEISNFGTTSVDLSGWTLEYYEGSTAELTVALSGTLAPNTAYVIAARSSHTTAISPNIVSSFNMNSGAYAILKEGTTVRDEAGSSSDKFNDDFNYEFIDCSNDNKPTSNWGNLGTGNGTPGVVNCNTPEPEIKIEGNSTEIASGDVTPSTTDDTDFGATALTGGTLVKTFTIYNTGDLALDLNGAPIVAVSGANAADFTVTTAPSTPVAITTGSTTFQITFDPSALGTRNATISIDNNDTDEDPYTFAIQGNGVNSNTSDITANAAFTYSSNIDYTLYQTATVDVFEFDIRDGGAAANDLDLLGTELTAITFNVDKIANIKDVTLYDGTTLVGTGTVGASTIVFTGISATATDNATKTLTLKVNFETTVTDNDQLEFTVASATANSSGSVFAAADAGGAVSSTAADDNRIEVTATKLVYTTNASNSTVGANMATVVVAAQDALNNTDLDYTSSVSISSTGTMTGSPVSVTASAGVASFSSLVHTVAGTGFNLTATSVGLTSVTTSAFDVVLITYNHGDFKTTSAGVWNNRNDVLSTVTWERYTTANGWQSNATSPSGSGYDVYINHNVEIPTITTQHATSKIIVNDGATLTFKASNQWTFRNLIIKTGGTVDMQTRFTMLTSGDFEIEDGGNFWFNYSANAASSSSVTSSLFNGNEVFHPNSNFIVKDHETGSGRYFLPAAANLTVQTYNGVTGYFGNLIFDGTEDSRFTTSNLSSTSIYLTHGNLEFGHTKNVNLFHGSGTWIVGGDFIFRNTSTGDLTMTTGTNTINLIVKKDFINNSNQTFRLVNASANPPNVTLNVDGDIILTNSGIIDLNFASGATGTINLKGDLTVASTAQLFANNATTASFNFNGTGDGLSAATTQTIDVASTNTENIDFKVNSGAYVQLINQDFNLASASKMTVENGGTFDFGFNGATALNITNSGEFVSENGSTLKITSTDGIVSSGASGNVQTGTRTFSTTDGIYHFIGKADQVTGNALPATARQIVMDMENVDNVTLSQNVAVTENVNFINGRIVSTATDLLSINDAATATGASDASYVSGPCRKIGDDDFEFPVGKDGNYQMIGISNHTGTDEFTAEYFQADPHPSYNENSKDGTIDHISSCEYWILDRANNTSNVNVKLTWDANSCDVTKLSDLLVSRWDGTTWKDHGNGATTGLLAAGTVTTSALVTSFSPFTLASTTSANPLPVELLSFTAEMQNENVLLAWTTATEINNDFFEVQRSANGLDFETIEKVIGAGNSASRLNYELLDQSPLANTSYYRLKQVDFNGDFEYSKIISLSNSKTQNLFGNIYPNPTSSELNITLHNSEAFTVQVVDMSGRIVYSQNVSASYSIPSFKLDVSALVSGLYLVQLSSQTETKTIQFEKK